MYFPHQRSRFSIVIDGGCFKAENNNEDHRRDFKCTGEIMFRRPD